MRWPLQLVAASSLLLLWVSPAAAGTPETRVHGPSCPPIGCPRPATSGVGQAAALGLAVILARAGGRRSRPPE